VENYIIRPESVTIVPILRANPLVVGRLWGVAIMHHYRVPNHYHAAIMHHPLPLMQPNLLLQ